MDYSCAIYLTKRGTRSGDPTADLLFGFLLNAFFDSVERQVEKLGLCEHLPAILAEPLTLLPAPPPFLGYASWARMTVCVVSRHLVRASFLRGPARSCKSRLRLRLPLEWSSPSGGPRPASWSRTGALLLPTLLWMGASCLGLCRSSTV